MATQTDIQRIIDQHVKRSLKESEGREFDASHVGLGDTGVRELVQRIQEGVLPHLTTLGLRGNQIGDGGAQCIAEGLPQLTSVKLGFNKIGCIGAAVIASQLSNLETIELRFNALFGGMVGTSVLA